MNLDKVRARPFLLLMISDAVESGSLSAEQLATIESQLVDMSLKIAKGFFSPVISHDLKKSCAIVMGVTTLGLLKLCEGDTLKARKLLQEDSIVSCFRKGWESVNNLFKAHGERVDRGALLAYYQYSDSEYKDIASIHQVLMAEQLDVNLLKKIAAQFKNPISNMDMDPDYIDETSIKSDVQLSIFEALLKRHDIGHRDYDNFKDLLFNYLDEPDVFFTEFSEAAEAILKKLDTQLSTRIEAWLESIEDDFVENFELLAIENSGPEIYISIFHSITRGNINAKKFMHAYESLLKTEKQLHPNLKEQIDVEYSYQNLVEEENDYLTEEEVLGELSENITDDDY
ncbi:MAG: hypothetical protein V7784_02145 [Oceanospirillaceae bacterium]